MVAFLERKLAEEYPGLSRTDAQTQLGKDAGKLSLSTMQRVMSGKTGPSIDTLSDIAYALGCTLSEMLSVPSGSPSRPDPTVLVETSVMKRFRARRADTPK